MSLSLGLSCSEGSLVWFGVLKVLMSRFFEAVGGEVLLANFAVGASLQAKASGGASLPDALRWGEGLSAGLWVIGAGSLRFADEVSTPANSVGSAILPDDSVGGVCLAVAGSEEGLPSVLFAIGAGSLGFAGGASLPANSPRGESGAEFSPSFVVLCGLTWPLSKNLVNRRCWLLGAGD